MNTYKLTLAYNGFQYFGWQSQKKKVPTIQEELNVALKKINKNEEILTIGSGRTDAKVHALGQIVKVEIPYKIECEDLKKALNGLLPIDIRVRAVETCKLDFHPIFHAKSKEYIYLFKENPSLFEAQLVARHSSKCDFDLISLAMKKILGKHDFQNYMCVGTPVKSTVREIFEVDILKNTTFDLGELELKNVHLMRFNGSGFLKQMVRLLVGAMWKIGENKLGLENFERSLHEEFTQKLGPVAPGHGLYLKSVSYSI